jgi:hypothetical protein
MKSVPLQPQLSGFDASTLPPLLLAADPAPVAVNEKVERWLAPAALAVVALALLSVLLL